MVYENRKVHSIGGLQGWRLDDLKGSGNFAEQRIASATFMTDKISKRISPRLCTTPQYFFSAKNHWREGISIQAYVFIFEARRIKTYLLQLN